MNPISRFSVGVNPRKKYKTRRREPDTPITMITLSYGQSSGWIHPRKWILFSLGNQTAPSKRPGTRGCSLSQLRYTLTELSEIHPQLNQRFSGTCAAESRIVSN